MLLNLTAITHFLSGAVFMMTGISLRKTKASRLFPLFFWFLAISSYLWGTASLLPYFGFLLEGYLPIPLGGLVYFLALTAFLAALYFLTQVTLSLFNPSLKNFVSRTYLLWGGLILFLTAVNLPYPFWTTTGISHWNLKNVLVIVLGGFVAIVSVMNSVLLFMLAGEAYENKLKLRGFLLAVGLIMYTFSLIVQHLTVSFEQYLFAVTVGVLGSVLMLGGVTTVVGE